MEIPHNASGPLAGEFQPLATKNPSATEPLDYGAFPQEGSALGTKERYVTLRFTGGTAFYDTVPPCGAKALFWLVHHPKSCFTIAGDPGGGLHPGGGLGRAQGGQGVTDGDDLTILYL